MPQTKTHRKTRTNTRKSGTTAKRKAGSKSRAKVGGRTIGKVARPAAKRGINARYPWKEEPNPYFELRTSAIQGTGAFATRNIRKGTRIIEYLGQRISWRTADKRYDDEKMGRHHTFLFTVDDKTVHRRRGERQRRALPQSLVRRNCEAITDRKRIFIEARRTIRAGDELLYDYQYERTDDHTEEDEKFYACRCGSPKCRGTILAPKSPARSEHATAAVAPTLRALLAGLVDYAGLFPPASARRWRTPPPNYASHLAVDRRMDARPIRRPARAARRARGRAPAARGPARRRAWRLSVLVSADPAAMRGDSRLQPRARRSPACGVQSSSARRHGGGRRLRPRAAATARSSVSSSFRSIGDPRHARGDRAAGARAKMRTGGVTPDAFPSADELARFIARVRDAGSPIQGDRRVCIIRCAASYRLTYDAESPSATMFGFLNVFVAAALARAGAEDGTLVAVLRGARSGRVRLRRRQHALARSFTRHGAARATRRDFALSFGSCSFREPVDELKAIGLL